MAGILLLLLPWVDRFSVTPSCGRALPPWLLSNALDRCNDLRDRSSTCSGPTVSVFSPVDNHLSIPLRPVFLVFEEAVSFVLGSLQKGLGLVFVTGPPGPRNQWAPASIPRPVPVNGLGQGISFFNPCPWPSPGPRPVPCPEQARQ